LVDHPRTLHLASSYPGAPFSAHAQHLTFGTRWRRRDYFEILAVLEGSGRLVSYDGDEASRVQTVGPGQLMLFKTGAAPLLEPATAAGLDIAWVSFFAADWRIFAGLAGLDSAWAEVTAPWASEPERGSGSDLSPFETALRRFHDGADLLGLIEFLAEVAPKLIEPSRTDAAIAPRWLVESWAAMLDEPLLRVGIPGLEDVSGVGRSRLDKLTRRHFGVTPTAFVNELRLRHAARLLVSTADSVDEIARRCGFHRSNYFTDRFHRMHGLSPRHYRAQSPHITTIAEAELRTGPRPAGL
jgi:AraC-like DNA-binding protein